MGQFLLKMLVSALLVAGASELARRSTVAGALLVSLPLTSLLALVWLWRDTHDAARIAAFSTDILWLVLPSLALFIVLPLALRGGFGFWTSLGAGVIATAAAYGAALLLRGAFA
jgi:F0F1-type ATP synthase assembly protein I